MKQNYFVLFSIAVVCLIGCQNGPKSLESILIGNIGTQLNPYQIAPLSASLSFTTKDKCSVEYLINGEIPVTNIISTLKKVHEIPVIGLYPNKDNVIDIILTNEGGRKYSGQVNIQTKPLPDFLPTIDVVKKDRSRMEEGFHLIEMLIANNGKFLTYTILFDDNGVIRWVMDMSQLGQITYKSNRLKNGNFLYLSWIDLLEMNPLGKMVKKEQMWGHAASHELIELPSGNMLMGGSKKDSKIVNDGELIDSRFDFVVEWDRSGAGSAVREWDLRNVLDVDRSVYPADYSLDSRTDWFHLNSIAKSPQDDYILVSGRNQGVLKVDMRNQLQWILAPHKAWGKAGYNGDGIETKDYLLTAVDSEGKPYNDDVQNGIIGTDDFEWSTGQHALNILENGNVLLFDNGLMRNFVKGPTYSRAVEYKIDDQKKTIQQVWQYGKERELDMFSPITSDVDVLKNTGNRLITLGTVRAGSKAPHAKLIEITYPDNEIVFEAHIYFKDALGSGKQEWAQFDLVYRGERFPINP